MYRLVKLKTKNIGVIYLKSEEEIRYHETQYLDEKPQLKLKGNGSYTFDNGVEINDSRLIETSKRQSNKRRTNG